jgi:hypothetical protein
MPNCCKSPQLKFAVRNSDSEPLANNTRTTIALPAGSISAEGLAEIQRSVFRNGSHSLAYDLDALGNQWQTRTGNYTKRLSGHAYKDHQVKLPQELLSQIGCIARNHSDGADLAIEVTRDLNQSSEKFGNPGSCWWDDYYRSRCALKTNGGLALRSFDGDSDYVTGRAWVMPLRQSKGRGLTPTFDTLTPDAFAVFNGYGDLSGYAAPRVVTQMAGWTYHKISFTCDPMYVNSGGYLVTSEEIAERYELLGRALKLSVNAHSSLFDDEREEQAKNAA